MYISTVDDGLPGGDQTVAEQLRDELEAPLLKYQVDLAVRADPTAYATTQASSWHSTTHTHIVQHKKARSFV